jgi:nucleotide-binding universal stress UspA family protein
MGTILVGVDGSESAQKAAEVAAQLARAQGDDLVLVVAHPPRDGREIEGPGSDTWHDSGRDDALAAAQQAEAKLSGTGVKVTRSACEGKPAKVLIDEAERLGARMIVIGNRRMQGSGRLLGSVANEVAHHAPCDVYIVKTT